MSNQAYFDDVADALVEQGVRVTYDSLNDAFKERDRAIGGRGRGKSDRDLQRPFDDWKRRRRYRPYLAHLDLPDEMDKAIAAFVDRAMSVARQHAVPTAPASDAKPVSAPDVGPTLGQQFAELAVSMQERMDALAEDYRSLRDQVLNPSAGRTDPPARKETPAHKREGRRRGLAAAMGRTFWDAMMQDFVKAIRKRGPMTATQLLETLDEDALAMAAAAFEPVTVVTLTEKVAFRIKKGRYFQLTPEGLYDLLPSHAARAKRA